MINSISFQQQNCGDAPWRDPSQLSICPVVPALEPYVDARVGGKFLGIHPKTLMRLARLGEVPAHPISDGIRHHWRFLLSELDTWMKSKVNSTSHPVRPRPRKQKGEK